MVAKIRKAKDLNECVIHIETIPVLAWTEMPLSKEENTSKDEWAHEVFQIEQWSNHGLISTVALRDKAPTITNANHKTHAKLKIHVNPGTVANSQTNGKYKTRAISETPQIQNTSETQNT